MPRILEIIGWYGTIAIVTSYALLSFSVLESTSLIYQILNLTGSMGIIAISFYKKDYQPGVLNIIWLVIALVSIFRTLV